MEKAESSCFSKLRYHVLVSTVATCYSNKVAFSSFYSEGLLLRKCWHRSWWLDYIMFHPRPTFLKYNHESCHGWSSWKLELWACSCNIHRLTLTSSSRTCCVLRCHYDHRINVFWKCACFFLRVGRSCTCRLRSPIREHMCSLGWCNASGGGSATIYA